MKSEIDYISLHTYIGNRDNNFEKFLGASQDIDHRIDVVEGLIKAAQSGEANPRPIYIAYDEWNVWYRARGNTEFASGATRLEEIYNYEDSLAMGMFLNSFFRHANVVKMANLAQLVNVIAPMFTNKDGMFLQPIFFPLAEYAKQAGNTAIDALVTSPTYKVAANRPAIGYLDVSVTHDKTKSLLFVNVLNRSEKQDIAASIDNQTGTLNARADVWEMNHPDLKATHTFGADQKVRPVVKTAAVAGNSIRYTFPKHSLTILRVGVK